ncbi:MAG: serine/threonine-protein kinase [Patescibacteria group bacterium]
MDPRTAQLAQDLEGSTFRWVRRLGKGGMADVHVVEHVEFGTKGVLKLLREELETSADLESRLRTEARLLKSLNHPNLVRVLDFARTGSGRPFLVTELLEGETLGDCLRREKLLSESEAIEIGIEILAGLEAVHAAGIVHRDVKPDNIFLVKNADGTRVVKLLDFGVAKLMTEAAKEVAGSVIPTATGLMIGTPSFMAPEQIRTEQIDARADLYAVGAVLYRMVVGEPPFTGKTQVDILQGHLLEPPLAPYAAAPQPVSKRLSNLILRALEKKRDDRFPSANMMRMSLEVMRPSPAIPWVETARLAPVESKTDRMPAVAAPRTQAVREERREGTTYAQRAKVLVLEAPAKRPVLLPRHTRPLDLPLVAPAAAEDDAPTVIETPRRRSSHDARTANPEVHLRELRRLKLALVCMMLLVLGLIALVLLRGAPR